MHFPFCRVGCQRFDMFLGRRRAAGDAQRGMIILDKTTRETSLQLSSDFTKVGARRAFSKTSLIRLFLSIPAPRCWFRSQTTSPTPSTADTMQAMPSISTSKAFIFGADDNVIHGLAHVRNAMPAQVRPASAAGLRAIMADQQLAKNEWPPR